MAERKRINCEKCNSFMHKTSDHDWNTWSTNNLFSLFLWGILFGLVIGFYIGDQVDNQKIVYATKIDELTVKSSVCHDNFGGEFDQKDGYCYYSNKKSD